MFPQSFIDQVKQATDMVKLASKYTELKKASKGVYVGRCPSPKHNDSEPSFVVWEKDQSWACMGCHHGKKNGKDKIYGSDCIAFIQWIEKKSWINSILYLAKEAEIPVPTDENQKFYDKKKILAQAYSESVKGEVLEYLSSRGLNHIDIAKWGLGFDGQKIIFPLYDRYNNILGFSKRWLHKPPDRNDKYTNPSNSKIFNKSCYFYGIQFLSEDSDEIRITEGPMDVILGNKYGVKNLVATQGTAFTETHAEVIKNLGKTPVFIYDGDKAGLDGINRAIGLLAAIGVYSKILILPNEKDLADMSNEIKYKIEDYIKSHAVTYGEYKISNTLSKYDSMLIEAKLKLLPEIKEVLSEIPNEDERKIITDMIKHRMNLDL